MKKILRSRYFYMVVVGVIIQLLLGQITLPGDSYNAVLSFLISIFITFLVWEGSHQIDLFMNKNLPWESSPFKRILFQAIGTLVYSAGTIYLILLFYDKYFCKLPEDKAAAAFASSMIVGVLVTFILVSVKVSAYFFNRLKLSLVEIEMHKKDSLQAQLENLRNQINPHFLFNNLSVLSSLVYKDQDKAIDFIDQLSKVYRYVLENKDKELVEVGSELKFIESYCFLLKIRFGENIKFKLDVDKNDHKKFIAPMALQLLIENAIKHNEVSEELPLIVKLYCEDQYMIISNDIHIRKGHIESSKTGLKNIISRYSYFTKLPVVISAGPVKFEVKIPILNTDDFD